MNDIKYREYYTRRKQEKGTLDGFNIDNWEEIPDEDLWEDGELESLDVKNKIYLAVVKLGNWKLIRRIEE